MPELPQWLSFIDNGMELFHISDKNANDRYIASRTCINAFGDMHHLLLKVFPSLKTWLHRLLWLQADWKIIIYLKFPVCEQGRLTFLWEYCHRSRMRRQAEIMMALRRGLLHVNLLVRGSNCNKFCSFVGVRSFSARVSTEAETSSVPETTSDHLIYTQEHFALKESLRKVRRTDC